MNNVYYKHGPTSGTRDATSGTRDARCRATDAGIHFRTSVKDSRKAKYKYERKDECSE